jgi:RNA polymerase sigma-70 factor (ECF subfamily)
MMGSGFDICLDEVTLAGAKRGDMRACEKIYRSYHGPAYSLAVRICKCRELARDVTQEAFITAFKRVSQFRGDAPFWGWLRRVVINHAISALRKQPRHDAVELEDYMAHTSGDQDGLGRAMDLSQALEQLSDEDRLVVWLHDVEGYKHREIAQMVNKTESYSKTRLNRARARLRTLVTDNDERGTVKITDGAARNATA